MATESTELKPEQIPHQDEGADDEVREEAVLRYGRFGSRRLHASVTKIAIFLA